MRVVCKILDQYPKSHKTQKRKNQFRHSTRSYLFLSNVIMSIRGLGPPCSVPVYLFGDRTCSPSTVRSQQTSNGSCGNCFKGSWQWVELIWLGGGEEIEGNFISVQVGLITLQVAHQTRRPQALIATGCLQVCQKCFAYV